MSLEVLWQVGGLPSADVATSSVGSGSEGVGSDQAGCFQDDIADGDDGYAVGAGETTIFRHWLGFGRSGQCSDRMPPSLAGRHLTHTEASGRIAVTGD